MESNSRERGFTMVALVGTLFGSFPLLVSYDVVLIFPRFSLSKSELLRPCLVRPYFANRRFARN